MDVNNSTLHLHLLSTSTLIPRLRKKTEFGTIRAIVSYIPKTKTKGLTMKKLMIVASASCSARGGWS